MKKMILLAAGLIMILVSIVIIAAIVGPRGPQEKLLEKTMKLGGQEFKIEVADTMSTRERGLSGREKLEDNEGMLFIFPYSGFQAFWMKDMKFALDMIWIQDDVIVGITENVPPPASGNILDLPSYPSPQSVNKVLEVNAGTVSRLGIKTGDKIDLSAL